MQSFLGLLYDVGVTVPSSFCRIDSCPRRSIFMGSDYQLMQPPLVGEKSLVQNHKFVFFFFFLRTLLRLVWVCGLKQNLYCFFLLYWITSWTSFFRGHLLTKVVCKNPLISDAQNPCMGES